jgi:transketolase
MDAFNHVRQVQGKPQIIIANTDKGKFLSPFTADKNTRKHGVTLTADEEKIALAELDQRYQAETAGERNGNR